MAGRITEIDQNAASARLCATFSPDEMAEENRRYRAERAKLVSLFGEKNSYSDEEIEEMMRSPGE
jgi:hypothetical protein